MTLSAVTSAVARHVVAERQVTLSVEDFKHTAANADDLAITEIHATDGFLELAPEWRALLAESDSDCLFLTWEWLHTWWRCLGGSRRLCILEVRRGGELVGIAPFAMRAAQPRRLLPFSAVEFLGTGTVGSDYLDLIIKRGEEVRVCAAIADHVSGWNSVLDLRRIKLGHGIVELLVRELECKGWRAVRSDDDACAYVPLSETDWDPYIAGLGSSFRAALRRKRRKAQRAYSVKYSTVLREEDRPTALKQFISLHRMRWNSGNGSQALPDEAIVRFHERWSRIALKNGWLRLAILNFDNRAVAGIYNFSYRGKLYFYLSGFDPEYGAFSPGRLCQEESLRCAFEERLEEYDFLHGSESYKYHWARDSRDLTRYHLFPPGYRGGALKLLITAREGAKFLLGKGAAVTRMVHGDSR